MQLLPENKLIWSPIVANCRMNRERNSSGVNSYEKEFKFKPEIYLASKIKEYGTASWLDLCCGQGNALIQTAAYFSENGIQQNIKLKGIDLLDSFQPGNAVNSCLTFEVRSVVDYIPDLQYDLITCVHGIHYLGDKLKVIETAIDALNPQGMFIANIDLANIIIKETNSTSFLKDCFIRAGIKYNSKTKILERAGGVDIKLGLRYIGADDCAGPNYTGQDAVTSYYEL